LGRLLLFALNLRGRGKPPQQRAEETFWFNRVLIWNTDLTGKVALDLRARRLLDRSLADKAFHHSRERVEALR